MSKPILAAFVTCLLLHSAVSVEKPVEFTAAQQEWIPFDQVKINGHLPLESRKEQLVKELGKPDSLVNPDMSDVCTSLQDKPFSYAYFKGSKAEVYENMAMMGNFEFAGNAHLTLTTATITLSNKTTLVEVAKYFPKAVAAKSMMDVYQKGKYLTVHIPTSKTPTEDHWILFFRNGKLARIDYWMPC